MMKSGIGDVEIRPGIFVHAAVATFLSKRLQWIEGGEEGPFQVTVPSGLEFDDLCTLALLLAKDQLGLAKEMVDHLSRRPMVMMPSATFGGGNDNYLVRNPFKRRKKRGKKFERSSNESVSGHPSYQAGLTVLHRLIIYF